jgi:hypothetical protein
MAGLGKSPIEVLMAKSSNKKGDLPAILMGRYSTERRIIFFAGYLRIATSNITMTENEYMMGKTHEMGGLPPSGLVVTYA